MTFGRLVVTINGDTYVISGNAGGNRPGGGILGHVNILNQTENEQVVNARPTSYGVGTIAGPNPRIITAGGVTFQLSDRGEPGRGLDLIRIFGQTLAIERGNIQYHANCRGPGS